MTYYVGEGLNLKLMTADMLLHLFLCAFSLAFLASGATSFTDSVSYANVGSLFSLNCTCPSTDCNITTAWYFNNIPLCLQHQPQQEGVCFPLANVSSDPNIRSTLLFSHLTLEHAGWYTCAAVSDLLAGDHEEVDYLLLVREPPSLGATFLDQLIYTTVENSRVELPCSVSTGHPHPDITWLSNEEDLTHLMLPYNYTINHNTGSLILHDVQESSVDGVSFRCIVSNEAGSDVSANVTVTVKKNNATGVGLPFTSVFGDLIDTMESALYYAENETDILSLACTNLTTEELSMLNFTVQWWERSAMSVETNEVPVNLSSSSSGFYCCQVLTGGGDPVLTVCATLVIVGPSHFTSPPQTITLPAKRNRVANLLCQGPTSSNINTPLTFSWENVSGLPLIEEDMLEITVSSSEGLSYLRVTNLESAGRVLTSCNASRFIGEQQVSHDSIDVSITIVDVCSSDNALRGFGTGVDDANEGWSPVGSANYSEVNFEKVLVIEGNTSLVQIVHVSGDSVLISGRMRHTTGTGIAEIRVLLDDAPYMVLTAPDPTSIAWQWVSALQEFDDINPATLKIELALNGGGGVAYFDHLCITFPQSIFVDPVIVAAVSSGAAGLILVMLAVLLCIGSCHPQPHKHNDAVLMSKVNNTILKRRKIRHDTEEEQYQEINDLKIAEDEDMTVNIINEPTQKNETFHCRASNSLFGTIREEPRLLQQESNADAEEDIYMNEGNVGTNIVSTVQEEPRQESNVNAEDIYMNEGLNLVITNIVQQSNVDTEEDIHMNEGLNTSTVQEDVPQQGSNINAEEDIYMNEGLDIVQEEAQQESNVDTEEDIYMNEGLNVQEDVLQQESNINAEEDIYMNEGLDIVQEEAQQENNADTEEDIYMNEGLNDIVDTDIVQEEAQQENNADTEEDIYMNEGLNENDFVSHGSSAAPKGIIGKEKIVATPLSASNKPSRHSAFVLNSNLNTGDKHPRASKSSSASSLALLRQTDLSHSGNSDKAEIYTYASPHPDWALGRNRKPSKVEEPTELEESIYY